MGENRMMPLELAQSASLDQLENELAAQQTRLLSIPQGHPGRALALDQQSVLWYYKYKNTRKNADIEEAVRLSREALDAILQGERGRSTILGHLSVWLHDKFLET